MAYGGMDQLVSLYHTRGFNIPEQANEYREKFSVTAGRVTARATGLINGDYLKFLTSNGFEFNKDTTRNIQTTSGGHAGLRFLADTCHAALMNRLPFDRPVVLIDVGAKYLSQYKVYV